MSIGRGSTMEILDNINQTVKEDLESYREG